MSSQNVPKKIDLSMLNTKIVDPATYDTDRIIFDTVQVLPVPNMKNVYYRRINLYTLNEEDKSIGELTVQTPRLFSYGVKFFTDEKTKEINGYTLALCCWSREGPTAEEKAFTDFLDNVRDKVKAYLLANKAAIERYDITEDSLVTLDPLYWKEEKGVRVPGLGPVLNAKLIATKKNNEIKSLFYDVTGDPVSVDKITEKYCHATSAIKIESIYIASGKGGKIKLQVKLHEACVEIMQNNMTRLLPQRPKPQLELKATAASNMNDFGGDDNDESLVDENDTQDSQLPAKAAPAPVAASVPVTKPAVAKRVAVKAKPKPKAA